jgi:hypothetical protein
MTMGTLLLPAESALPAMGWPPAPPPAWRRLPYLLAAVSGAALLVAAWSATRPAPPLPEPSALPIPPLPPVAAEPPAVAVPPLAPGAGWALDEALPRLEGRLDATSLEIRDLVEAIVALRRDSALLAEDGQLAHERLEALEARLSKARARAAKPLPAPTQAPAGPKAP